MIEEATHSNLSFRKYLLSFYFTVLTIVTVGYGDLTPQNSCSRATYADEKGYIIMLIMIGVFVYSKLISSFSSWYIDEKMIAKSKQYSVLSELKNGRLISEKLVDEISQCIENAFNDDSKTNIEEWLDLVKTVDSKFQPLVAPRLSS